MPEIIVTAGSEEGFEETTVMLRERVNQTDFESQRFTANLLERLGWAVEDATAAEQLHPTAERDLAELPRLRRSDPQPHRDPEPVGIA
jgi:hypothetical protein